MRTFKLIQLAICSIALAVVACSCSPGTDMVSAAIASKGATDAADKIAWSLDRATANADFAMEKNLRRLQLMSDSLQQRLEDEMEINREFVSSELANSFTKLNELVEQVQGGVLEIQDFAVLDVQNIINQIPFKKDLYLIRRVEGYGVMFKSEGTYDIVVYGNAFQPGNRVEVSIDDQPVDPNNVFADKVANVLQFSIPATELAGKFSDSELVRIGLAISVFKGASEDSFYSYNGSLQLLPKFPVRYSIIEKHKESRWTGDKGWATFQREMGPTGKNKKWDYYTITCEAPAGTRFTRQHRVGTSGSHSTCSAPNYLSDTSATVNCANQTHDAPRTATASLEYQHSEEHLVERELTISSGTVSGNLLGYGTHVAELSPKHVTFTAEFTYFNGRKAVLHKQKSEEYGIKILTEISPDSSYRRLLIEVDDPVFN